MKHVSYSVHYAFLQLDHHRLSQLHLAPLGQHVGPENPWPPHWLYSLLLHPDELDVGLHWLK